VRGKPDAMHGAPHSRTAEGKQTRVISFAPHPNPLPKGARGFGSDGILEGIRRQREKSITLPPQSRIGRVHEAAIEAEAMRAVLGEQQGSVEIDQSRLLPDQEGRRHAQ